jgi:D-alanyl-D-alanine carboxypeptidase
MTRLTRRWIVAAALAMIAGHYSSYATANGTAHTNADAYSDRSRLEARLARTRHAAGLPAIAAAIITTDEIATAATGVRRLGATERVTVRDLWHLGSCGKSMTGVVFARLVEQGLIRWDSRIEEVLPELTAVMRPEYRSVTLEQLLRHRGGIVPLGFLDEILALPQFPGSPTAQRLAFAAYALALLPSAPIGEYAYSNGGYALAAAMAERVTHRRYEQLARGLLFGPLDISVQFGWPTQRSAAQPWGHIDDGNGGLVPIDLTEPQNAFPRFLTPAGNMSLTIGDFARYVQLHLRGLRGEGTLLQFDTFRRLHTPTLTRGQSVNYATGWDVFRLRGERTSFHDGEASTFYAIMYVQARRNRAVVIVTNAVNEAAVAALDTLAQDLLSGAVR